MSVSEIVNKVDELIGLLTELKERANDYSKMNRVLISPGNIWAIVDVGYVTGDELDVVLPSTSGGVVRVKFKRYSGEYIVYQRSYDDDMKVLKLDDGTEVNFEWIDDIATIFGAMYGGVKKNVLKDMLANIYSSGKDKPVGFLYDRYLAVIAPIVRDNPIE